MNNQDQRPVFMGTFSKYTKAYDHKIATIENSIDDIESRLRFYIDKLNKQNVVNNRILLMMTGLNLLSLAIYLLTIFK